MTVHFASFSSKFKSKVPHCRRVALAYPTGQTTEDKENVTCKACRKALALPPLDFKVPEGTHSDKAMATFQAMGTLPGQWRLADIRWVTERRMVPGEVSCPDCDGWKLSLKDAAGKPVPCPKPLPYGHADHYKAEGARRNWVHEARKADGGIGSRGTCDRCRCRNSRARMYGYSTGKVEAMVEREVMVGYPVWPEGTVFDSRFRHSDCELCGKSIPSGERVPVHTTGCAPEHGMLVGTDCARKFLNVTLKLKDDQMVETKR